MSAYAVVANDSIQTLGTFISSNKQRSWYQLWLWFGGLMVVTATVGWFLNGGDLSWGRLSHIPYPVEFRYKYILASTTTVFPRKVFNDRISIPFVHLSRK